MKMTKLFSIILDTTSKASGHWHGLLPRSKAFLIAVKNFHLHVFRVPRRGHNCRVQKEAARGLADEGKACCILTKYGNPRGCCGLGRFHGIAALVAMVWRQHVTQQVLRKIARFR